MNKNHLEFDVVSVEQNNLESLVVFQINKVSAIVRKTNVGQFVKSYPFELNFPTSIGKSKWIVILFLNGQYEAGQPNDLIYIYLKMLHCQHQSAEFKFDVRFQLGSEYATITKKDQRVCFDNVKTRWIGAKLMTVNEMIMNESRYICNDILMMTVNLNEHFKQHASSPEMSFNNSFLIDEQPYVKPEKMDVDLYDGFIKQVSSTKTPNKNNHPKRVEVESYVKSETMDIDFPALHKNSFQSNAATVRRSIRQPISENASGSTNRSSLASNMSLASSNPYGPGYSQNRICDSNLNYVDYEFSDDEDNNVNSANSKNSVGTKIVSAWKNFFGGPPK